jgi:hypothetical protein
LVNSLEPDSLDELIADCADIPDSLCTCHQLVLPQGPAARWEVNEACLAQVNDLDAYV